MVQQRGKVGLVHVEVSLRVPGMSLPGYEASFLVDTGATDSMAPASDLSRAGIQPIGRRTYEMADGSVQEYRFGLAQIEFMGEVTAGRVIFGPEGVEPILGVTALESVGMVVDPANQSLKRLPTVPLKQASAADEGPLGEAVSAPSSANA
jgi:clan AA aspartic protease